MGELVAAVTAEARKADADSRDEKMQVLAKTLAFPIWTSGTTRISN